MWGGGERYVLDLCNALRADGHSVAVVTRGKKSVDTRFAEAGFKPGRLPLRGSWDIISPIMLARVLNRTGAPVVVHAHNFKDADVALRARKLCRQPGDVRVVMTRHLVKAAKNDRLHNGIYNGLDRMIFVSDAAMREFLSTSPDIDRKKLQVVHNASVTDKGVTPTAKPDGELRLVFAGRISPEKGVEVLLHSLARLTDIPGLKLYIAGEGRGRDVLPLLNLARRLGVDSRVEWLGMLNDVAPLMASADIGVMPSVWKEPFGLVLTEFMSLGVPVVATAGGGPSEIIADGESGLLVPPSDPVALADAIRRLASDAALRKATGEKGRETVAEKFSYSRFYDQILDNYRG